MYDLIIKNGTIVDGTGSPSFHGDIAIRDGKIARIGRCLTGAAKEIDAAGLTVTPGFIDSHSHSDSSVFTYPDQVEKIEQGIILSIAGQCGDSPVPMDSFLQDAKDVPQGSHIAVLCGHGSIREAVMGMANREPTADELEKMKDLLRDGMEHGSLGMSFGLIYPPGCYAKTDELIELAKVVGEYHGIIAAHIRNEGHHLIRSTEEFIRIIRESGTRGVLSHHKSAYAENWGKVSHTLRMLDEANKNGIEIYCDVYPYTASHTSLSAYFLPKEYHALGRRKVLADPVLYQKIKAYCEETQGSHLDWVMVSVCSAYPEIEGKFISEIADLWGMDDLDVALTLLRDSENCKGCFFTMCEEDMETVLSYPRAMVCTDSGVARDMKVYHPRLRGTFPRVLGRYVRERGVTSLPEMIRKMTAMPAAVYELAGKGLLREGFDADICIFDADKIIDRAEYTDCHGRAEGLNYVLLGGEVVVENAVHNGKRLGRVILKDRDN